MPKNLLTKRNIMKNKQVLKSPTGRRGGLQIFPKFERANPNFKQKEGTVHIETFNQRWLGGKMQKKLLGGRVLCRRDSH
jgi:hypothetical protein